MTAKDAIRLGLDMGDRITGHYLGDLNDADLLVRPVPGMNHIAWQLGHLIAVENHYVELIEPGACPKLPEGFVAAHHGKASSEVDDPKTFHTKDEYLALLKAQREATRKVLDALPESRLAETNPEKYPHYAPSVGELLSFCSVHLLTHVGQWVAVRRMLGKPVAI